MCAMCPVEAHDAQVEAGILGLHFGSEPQIFQLAQSGFDTVFTAVDGDGFVLQA